MTHPSFETLLDAARAAHGRHPALHRFCAFPDDVTATTVTPHHIPAADLMARDPLLQTPYLPPLARAFVAAGPHATWRETYRNTGIGDDFLARFGCYCLIGPGGAYQSAQMHAFVVYMPPGLCYPRHHHPGEEMYFVLAGSAEFHRDGAAPEILGPGQGVIHASNQPHAAETLDRPLLAYVIWRSHLGIPPVLTTPAPPARD